MNFIAVIVGPLLLAQATEGPYSPPPLPPPPRLTSWLFENPWPPAIGLLAFAAILFFVLNARGQGRQGGLFAGVFAGLAALCILTSFLVTTDREILAERTRDLVAATASANLRELEPMLAGDVALKVLGRSYPQDKDGILGMVNQYMGNQVHVQSHSTSSLSANVDTSGTGKSLVRVWVEVEGISNRSWWRITWRKSPIGEWNAVHIEGLQIDFVRENMLP